METKLRAPERARNRAERRRKLRRVSEPKGFDRQTLPRRKKARGKIIRVGGRE